ncbi:leucine-rich repeat-containing protein 51-like [Trichogramma pretiosum]|uniref:leucine-rich repeat-containing protein 51-like n=1 Tax=Trichogramma pretiosum TaxID=7493 RepID=UPI0006C95AD9|nr:leucine-rich repeat-containing protein 51-like [Trichogramma pretiosum]
MSKIVYSSHATYNREASELMHAGAPIDLSFKQARNVKDLLDQNEQELRISRTGRLPGKGLHNRYLTSSIWLSNNCFKNVCCLHELANRYLENPRELRWLDLSYNRIEDIDDDLLKIQSLSILYLHGNRVENMKSIVKLRQLKSLRTLTLHGNPIERKPDYRQYIVAILPQIQNLDFSPVIDYERRRALPPGFYKMVHVE